MKFSSNHRKQTSAGAVLALALGFIIESFNSSAATPAIVANPGDPDLSNEVRTLNSFVNDLQSFDKKCALLGKKEIINSIEFNTAQQSGDDIKRRLNGVQTAFQNVIKKLKGAGLWDDLDTRVSARVKDPKFQAVASQESFKKALEEVAGGLSNNASEFVTPLETLRKKVSARVIEQQSDSFAFRTVSAAYEAPAALVFKVTFKCRVAWLRVGIQRAFSDTLSAGDNATNAVGCYCGGDHLDCEFTTY